MEDYHEKFKDAIESIKILEKIIITKIDRDEALNKEELRFLMNVPKLMKYVVEKYVKTNACPVCGEKKETDRLTCGKPKCRVKYSWKPIK